MPNMQENFSANEGPEPQDRVVSPQEERRVKYEEQLHAVIREPLPGGHDFSTSVVENKRYKELISPGKGNRDPLLDLESYAEECLNTESRSGRRDIAEIGFQDALYRLTAIRKEIEAVNPDMQKIDAEVAGFMQKRLDLFLRTFNVRVEEAAYRLYNYYQAHPGELAVAGAPYTEGPRAIADNMRAHLPNPGQIALKESAILNGADWNTPAPEFKARALYNLIDEIRHASTALDRGGDPFIADIYKDTQDGGFNKDLIEEFSERRLSTQ